MANLSTNEKQVLEKLFQMGSSGSVLNFSHRTLAEFFRDDLQVDIADEKYNYGSGSKANRMRGFWQVASDPLVGKSVEILIAYIDTQILLGSLNRPDFPDDLIRRGQEIGARLLGNPSTVPVATEDEFISIEFGNISIESLRLEPVIGEILKQRIEEIRRCLQVKSSLAAIFLCGSTLEGVLLGIACANAKNFNQSNASPKDKTGKVKQFHEWALSDFINVAGDLKLVGEDVKKFSHALRDFRNYIHPYEQMSSGFNPDGHTAKICWQVLQAAITQLSR
ncbi:MAG: hypothetical protein ACYCSN_09565 [Acidobacteriaceae bacterium]